MNEPRRVELTAPQALKMRELYEQFAGARHQAMMAERQLNEAIHEVTKDVDREDDERINWMMEVGEATVELVEVQDGERPPVLSKVQ